MKVTAGGVVKLENGLFLSALTDGPQAFIPVFDTHAQAVEWAGSAEHVVALIRQTGS